MKKPSSQSNSFAELQKRWYKKLKDSGFEDIEVNGYLRNTTSNRLAHHRNNGHDRETVYIKTQAKIGYYRLAGFFLHDHKFDNRIEKTIWEMHAEGKSHRDISARLKSAGSYRDRNAVRVIIHKLKDLMIKMYKDELND